MGPNLRKSLREYQFSDFAKGLNTILSFVVSNDEINQHYHCGYR